MEFATDWNVSASDSASFLKAAQKAGTSPNGVFGFRIMWENVADLLAELANLHPGLQGPALLAAAFGRCRFVFLHRRDDVAQAVSRLIAEQTRHWHTIDGTPQIEGSAQKPRSYDHDQIAAYRSEATQNRRSWLDWFDQNGIKTVSVAYEDLASEPEIALVSLLKELGLELPADCFLQITTKRLADSGNLAWCARYRQEAGLPPTKQN